MIVIQMFQTHNFLPYAKTIKPNKPFGRITITDLNIFL